MPYFQQDPRIEDHTAVRDLEKKLHWCMQMLFDAGLVQNRFGNDAGSPDDLSNADVWHDAMEVKQELNQ